MKLYVVDNAFKTPFSLWAAVFMEVILGVIIYRLADLFGWMAIGPRANYPDAATWWSTVFYGATVMVALFASWVISPSFEFTCWRIGKRIAHFAVLAGILVATALLLSYFHPLEKASWNAQVIWGSLNLSWWTLFWLFLAKVLFHLWEDGVAREHYPWPG